MKKILLAIIFSFASFWSFACDYTLELSDSYGDGWDGADIEVWINGSYQNVYTVSGSGLNVTITVNQGDNLELYYSSGSYENEHEWYLYNSSGTLVASDGPTPSTGLVLDISADCGGGGVSTAGDCSAAINVCTDLGFQIDANGSGSVNEIPALGSLGNPNNNNPGGSGNEGCLRIGESNSTWMIINIAGSGNLEFNFGGSDQSGYYDWIMYPYNATSCTDIPANLVAPVRCNWNGCNYGGTGLDDNPSWLTECSSNFEPSLPVVCGEQYIICFSNYNSAVTDVPLVFGGTATVECMGSTCAGTTTCDYDPGNVAYQNCIGAIPVCQNVFCQEYAFSGVGSVTGEISTTATCLSSGEKNDAWYIFTVQQSGNVDFLITPNDLTDDYDWALFNLTDANCSQIPTTPSLLESCNYSGTSGTTGPNGNSALTTQGSGGTPYNAVVPVVTGETYVLNVSNFTSSNDGYILDFTASTAVIFDNVPPALDIITTSQVCGSTTITFRFTEQVLCSSVQACDFTITGPGGPYTVSSVTGPGCSGSGTQGSEFTVTFSPGLSTAGNFNLNLVSGCGWVEDLCGNVAVDGSLPFTIVGPTSSTTQVNVLCYGASTGQATVTVTGGSPNYTYDWSHLAPITNAVASNTVTGLSATPGTYSVTVTSNGGCATVSSVTITELPQMTIALTPNPESCSGANDGSIDIVVTNGASLFDYTCTGQPNQNNQPATYSYTGLGSGPYTIVVTDNNNCTASANTTVNAGGLVNAAFSYPGNQCFTGTNSFTFDNTSTGATSYLWTFAGGNPATSTDFEPTVTFNTAGAHIVTLTAYNGATCSDLEPITLTVYDLPIVTATPVATTCFGFSDGSISVVATGGSGIYTTYTWSPAQPNSPNASGLYAGNYAVTVKDSYNCIGVDSATVTEPAPLVVSASRNDISCNGLCDGNLFSSVVSGGSGSFNYAWDNGVNTQNQIGVCAGNYTVIITDALSTPSCNQTASVAVTEPSAMVLTTSSTNSDCTASNGTATITVNNGTPDFTYNWLWSTGNSNSTTASNTSTVNTLPAGNVSITVYDNSGCSKDTVINVNANSGPTSLISSSTNVTCNGSCNGYAEVTVTGGTPNYTYIWDGGAPVNTSSTTNSINTLCAGSHTVSITDANGCVTTVSVSITQPNALVATPTVISSHCGQSDGSISLNVAGGSSPYSYIWSSGETTQNISGKPAGTYCVTVTDAAFCTVTACATITDIGGITSLSTTQTVVSCFGGNNGTATVFVNGGLPPYSYSWENGQTTSTATGLSYTGNAFCVTVTDLNNCELPICVTITQPTQVTASISASDSVSCFGGNDGWATVVGSGGSTPYSYQWGAGTGSQVTATASNLFVGTYCVTVKDVSNCPASQVCETIYQPSVLNANITATVSAHCNNADGGATVTPTGGTPPYSFIWPSGTPLNAATVTGLPAGTYVVTVTDANGCTKTASATIINLPSGTASISIKKNASCNNVCDGELTVSVSGATPSYSYSWNTFPVQTTVTATGLCDGQYCVTVTDANNCTMTVCATITEPAVLTNSFNVSDINCFEACDGHVTSNPSGGTTPYTYLWDCNVANQTVNNVCAGWEVVTITDFNGCTKVDSVEFIEPIQISLFVDTIVNAHCNQKDGAINITASNGGPFSFEWINGDVSQNIDSIVAGSYCVTVTNSKLCTIDSCIIVANESGPIASITTFTNLTCYQSCDGAATVDVTDGSGAYTYLWSDGQTLATATNLCAGIYTVTVTDDVGCETTESVTITEPPYLNYFLHTTNPKCSDICDGQADVDPFGGTPPYTFTWDYGNNTSDSLNTGLCAQNYQIIITDANGCDTLGLVALSQPSNIVLTMSQVAVKCFGNNDGTATVNASGGTPGTPPYTYQWDVAAGEQTTQTASGLYTGTYCVTVKDGNGCSTYSCVTVTTPDELEIVVDAINDVTCYGDDDGSIITHAIGGVPPYVTNWSNSAQTSSVNNLSFGTYTISVADYYGCLVQTNIIVSQPPELKVTLDIHDALCKDENNGYILADAIGGTPITSANPWAFQWDDAVLQTAQTAVNLYAGTYSVTVTDGNGCTVSATGTVHEPSLLQMSNIEITNATCGSANGSATINMFGGTTGYQIIWSNSNWPGFTQDNLSAGFYGVTVTDWNDCSTETNILVNNENGPTIDTITKVDISCYGETNGLINVIYSGGTGAIHIEWSTSVIDTAMILDLGVGTYSVTLTDDNDCKAIGFEQILGPQYPVNSVINQKEDASCFGFCDASATVLTAGGTPYSGFPKYTYQWNVAETSQTASGLCAGVYSVVSTDSLGCTSIANVTLTEPNQIAINLIQLNNVSCANMNPPDGKITVNATGGSNIYNYNWQVTPVYNNPTLGQLGEGSYTVIVSDLGNAACFAIQSYDITIPEPIVATLDYDSPKCGPYEYNGSVFVTSVTGGVAPYSYYWGQSNYNDTLNGISSGNYSVLISDINNCSEPFPISVDYIHPPIIVLVETNNITCAQSIDGSALFVVKEGTSPFQYAWSPSNGSGIINAETDSINIINLSASYYNLTVTDIIGCDTSTFFPITTPTELKVIGNSPAGTICYGSNLTISASVQGGTPPMQYTWNQNLPSLASHVVNPTDLTYYNVTITDANGCTDSVSIPVYVYNPITVTLDASYPAVCKNDSVDLFVNHSQGAGAPFLVTWNNNIGIYPDQSFYVVPVGPMDTYTVTIKDKCNSTASASVNIEVYPLPKGIIESGIPYGCEPLTVDFYNALHQPGYTYNWDFGDFLGSSNYSHDAMPVHTYNDAGRYDISAVVISEDNCKDTILVEDMVNVFPNPDAAFNPYPSTTGAFKPLVTFFDQSTEQVVLWRWDFGDIASADNTSTEEKPFHSYSGPGIYNAYLYVETINHCKDSTERIVTILNEHTFYAPTAFAPSAGGINQEWYPVGIGVDPKNYHLYIYDRWGELIFESTVYYDDIMKTGETGKWNGKVRNKGKIVEMGVYAWYVQLKDVLGIDHEYSGTVTVIK